MQLRYLTLAAFASLLASCSLHRIDVSVCRLNGRLAFAPEDTKHWYGTTAARPLSAKVFDDSMLAQWESGNPHDLWDLMGMPISPRRKAILYGARYHDWVEKAAAKPLRSGHRSTVELETDGGMGTTEFVLGSPLSACPADGS